MRSFTATGEKAIGTTGFLLFGALTLIMAILKLTVITDWSWWRVSLPTAIIVGFNMVYILVGFIYLSLVNIGERPPEDKTALVEGHHRIPHDWISLLFFALFADNLVRWWEGAEGAYWIWLLSGQIEAVRIFAGLGGCFDQCGDDRVSSHPRIGPWPGPLDGILWFWLLSAQIEAVLIFAGLSVADLFLYWSRIGPTLAVRARSRGRRCDGRYGTEPPAPVRRSAGQCRERGRP